MKLSHYLSIFAIAAVVASCSKGDTGATGPQGPSGVPNINTQQYTVTSANWSAPTTPYTWIASFTESDITDNNNDAVEAYWSVSSSGWLALPATSLVVTGDQLSYGYDDDIVTFSYYTGGTNTDPISSYSGYSTIYFKVTVIPPSIQVKYPNVNWKNASEALQVPEVQAALGKSK